MSEQEILLALKQLLDDYGYASLDISDEMHEQMTLYLDERIAVSRVAGIMMSTKEVDIMPDDSDLL